jgi:putative hemolysin
VAKKKSIDLSTLGSAERRMVEEILAMRDREVNKIMVPANEIIAFPHNISLSRAIEIYKQYHYSRYPVYYERLDRVVGLFFIKEILSLWKSHSDMPVIEFVRFPYYVYEDRSALEVFLELQRLRISLGMVIDEFGSVSGIITIEDLIEEIVGDIEDEFDTRKKPYVERISENDYIVNTRMEIDDFCEYFNITVDEDDISTVGGLIIKYADRIPKKGEEIKYKDITFIVLEGTRRKISKVKVTIPPPGADNG